MANPEHVKIVNKGTAAISSWRVSHPKQKLDLSRAEFEAIDLREADLSGANFQNADIVHCKLQRANLTRSNLSGAALWDVDLDDAQMCHVSMNGAQLADVALRGVDLTGAQVITTVFDTGLFDDAVLCHAELAQTVFLNCWFSNTQVGGAKFGGTVMADVDLRGMSGLEKVVHEGPSTIGVDTLLNSQGNISEIFLRGCGLPDHVIAYAKSLAQSPIQYYTCFLSHSSKDNAFVKHLYDKLQDSGVRCWYFPETARTGESLRHEIDKAIRLYDKLVIVCSYNSLNSQPVIDEIEEGLKREEEEAVRKVKDEEKVARGELDYEDFAKRRYQERVLFPIMIDDYLLDGWNHKLQYVIKNRVVADFRKWKSHDSFSKQLDKLLHDLNAQDTASMIVRP